MATQQTFYGGTALESRTFPSTKHIPSKQHMAVWRRLLADSSWSVMDVSLYQLINNGCVLNSLINTTLYDQIEVRVADTADELGSNPSDTAQVAAIANEVITVAGISAEVVTTAGISASISTTAADSASIIITAADSAVINTAAGDTLAINQVSSDTSAINDLASDPMRSAILDVSSEPVRQAVLDAEGNATSSQLKAWESEAEKMTADSYATEAEDVVVKTYTSDGDGTFTATPTTEYSALHHSLKAQATAITIPSKTSARNSVISAVDGVNALATTPTPSHIDVAYTGNGTSQNIVTGLPSVSRPYDVAKPYVLGDYVTDAYVIYESIGTADIENGDFNNGTDSWVANGSSIASANGILEITALNDSYAYARQAITTVIGTKYFLEVDILEASNHRVRVGNSTLTTIDYDSGLISTSGTIRVEVTPTITDTVVHLINASGVATTIRKFDNVSFKESHTGTLLTDTSKWEAIADGVHLDADNADIWIKARANTGLSGHRRFDTLRGELEYLATDSTAVEVNLASSLTSFNADGFSLGTSTDVNNNLTTYVAWTEYFDKMFSWVDDDGFRGITAYNAQSGKFMVSYVGSGVAGKKVWHGLGTKPDFIVAKNREHAIAGWLTYDSPSGATVYKTMDDNIANTTNSTVWNDTEPTSLVIQVGSNVATNELNKGIIAYGSSNRKNHSYVGSYVGTGVAGNPVDVGMDLLALDTAGKNIKVITKKLSTTGSWTIRDNSRGDFYLSTDTSGAEVADSNLSYTNNGVTVEGGINLADTQYLIEVTVEDFNNPNGGLDLNPTTTSYADGTNATGDADVTATTIAPATYPQIAGTKNYFYTDFVDADTVTLGSTDVKLLEGLDRVDADKWGVISPSDATLKTTDKHSGYASGTGVASASSELIAGTLGAFNAFNKSELVNNEWVSTTGDNVGAWIDYNFSEKRVPKSLRFQTRNDVEYNYPSEISIYGKTGAVLTLIKSFTGISLTQVEWTAELDLINTSDYDGVRLIVDAYVQAGGVSTWVSIGELELNTEHPSGDFYNVAEGVMYGEGAENFSNSGFDDTTAWIKGSEWSIANGIASKSGTANESVYQSVLTVGKEYIISVDVVTPTQTELGARFYYNGTASDYFNTIGRHEFIFTATSIHAGVNGNSFTGGAIDNLSIKELSVPIKRVYTAEADVDGLNEIIPDTWVDRAVKNQNLTDVTVHGDAEFLGGFDLGQSWGIDLKSERFLGVDYKNEGNRLMFIHLTLSSTFASRAIVTIDGKPFSSTYSTEGVCSVSLPIPIGSVFNAIMSVGSSSIIEWYETFNGEEA